MGKGYIDHMKKIIINGMEIYGDKEPHGPQRFGIEVLNALDTIELNGNIVEVVLPQSVVNEIPVPRFNQIRIKGINYDMNKYKARFRFSKFCFPKYIKEQNGYGVDLALSYPFNHCDAICVFDCIIKETQEEFKGIKAKLWKQKFLFFEKNAIKKARTIITVSEYSRKKIEQYYGVKENKIILCGVGFEHIFRIKEDERIIEKLGLIDKDFYFSSGVGSGRKNFKWIIESARNNPSRRFVIAGVNGQRLIEELDGKGLKNLIVAGFVTDAEYKSLMKHSKAYIQPSFDEGFGIPPLEALALGSKAIVSKIPVFEEVYENCVYYINPNNYEPMDLENLLNDRVESSEKILEKYQWKKVATSILQAIEQDVLLNNAEKNK